MSIQRIPKLFFQTSKEPLKPYLVKMIKAMLSEEWTYMHFLDSDILDFFKTNPLEEFPEISEKFKGLKNGEHKADLFRYYFLYVNGGLFMDSDAMIYKPVDTIIQDYRFVSVNSAVVPGTIFQGILGAEPRNPLIYRALKSFYSMDLSILQANYHTLCKELYTFFHEIQDKTSYKLYNEIQTLINDNIRANKYLFTGDRIVNDEGETIFKHYWLNKEGIPNTLKSKNLVYCCVFYNKDYFKLLELLLKSMKMFSTVDSFDFLILTAPDFEPMVKQIARTLDLDLRIFCIDLQTIFQAACARLSIFDYPEISEYEKLLYLDTDILIKADLAPIFQLPIDDLLYGIESGNIGSANFGGQFFDFKKFDENLAGINSGTLLFLNSENMKNLFKRIKNHIQAFTNDGNQHPYCMDQPFINFHAIKDSLYNNQLLNSHVSLFEGNDTVENYSTSSICHFSFPIGNFGHKFYRMQEFLKKTLSKVKFKSFSFDLIGNKYTWGAGFIKFIVDETYQVTLETSWGKGTVTVLDYSSCIIEWNRYIHSVRFSNDNLSYMSIRINPGDFDFSTGSLIKSNLNIYGDSHGLMLFKNLKIDHRNLFDFGKTMFRVGRDQQIINFKEYHNNLERIFCLAYGEVDVRAHIGKQVHYGRHHKSVCKELVEAYFNAIKTNIVQYKSIIIVAIPPPVDSMDHQRDDHTHNDPLPFIGTNSDRVIYTNDMNDLLEKSCRENGYTFFNPFHSYKREDGTLKYELSDKCIHIGKNEEILKALEICVALEETPPIILHTCDAYKKFWNPWFYFCKKFIKSPRIYFLCEEILPDFASEVTCIKTGKGEWGARLLRGLEQIPEKYIFYMQEDFWPCKPKDLSIYKEYIANYSMDALRITNGSYLYSLEHVDDTLFKFTQNSQYLMTHQFSLWNKAFLTKNINKDHNPWLSEIEQSKIIARNPHSIYMIQDDWYNAVVTKGVLQPNGEMMLTASGLSL